MSGPPPRHVRQARSQARQRLLERMPRRGEDAAPSRRPLPDQDQGPVLEDELSERLARRPELSILLLVVGLLAAPFWLLMLLARFVRWTWEEQEHESIVFRFHDWTVRNPELGLPLALLGAGALMVAVFLAVLSPAILASTPLLRSG